MTNEELITSMKKERIRLEGLGFELNDRDYELTFHFLETGQYNEEDLNSNDLLSTAVYDLETLIYDYKFSDEFEKNSNKIVY